MIVRICALCRHSLYPKESIYYYFYHLLFIINLLIFTPLWFHSVWCDSTADNKLNDEQVSVAPEGLIATVMNTLTDESVYYFMCIVDLIMSDVFI